MKRELNQHQRVVLVIAWAALLAGLVRLVAPLSGSGARFVNVGQNNSYTYTDGYSVNCAALVAVRVVALVLWVLGSLWLLRTKPSASRPQAHDVGEAG